MLISYSGQAIGGKADEETSQDLILPVDARSDRLDQTGWSLPDALDAIACKGENPVLVWLDTSLSGRGRPALDDRGRRDSSRTWLARMTRWPLVSAWIASSDRAIPALEKQGRSPFLSAATAAMGTRDRPGNLMGAVAKLNRDPALASQGFLVTGGLGPSASLWPKMMAESVDPPSELVLQHGHSDRITAIAFSADRSMMVTASMDSTIRVWRMSDRVLLRILTAHAIGVTALSLSPDATRLASGDGSGRVLLWSMLDFTPTRPSGPSPHDRGIAKLQFLSDGSGFAALDLGGKAVLWKPEARSLRSTVLSSSATALATGDDVVAVAGPWGDDTPSIRIFDRAGAEIRRLAGPGGTVVAEALTIRDGRIAAGDRNGKLGIWKIDDGSVVKTFTMRAIETVVLGRDVAWATSDRSLARIPFGEALPSIRNANDGIQQVVTSDDGLYVALCTKTGEIFLGDGDGQHPTRPMPGEKPTATRHATVLAMTREAFTLVAGDQDGGIRLGWSGPHPWRIAPHRGKIDALSASPDGRYLLQIDHDRSARVWDLRDGRALRSIPGRWRSAAFLPDGSAIAMTRIDGEIVLIDAATHAARNTRFDLPAGDDGKVRPRDFGPIQVSPDGRYLLSGSALGPRALLWPIAGGPPRKAILGHEEPISAVDFSRDSSLWLTASLDGSVQVGEVEKDAPRWTLRAEDGAQPDADPSVTSADSGRGGRRRSSRATATAASSCGPCSPTARLGPSASASSTARPAPSRSPGTARTSSRPGSTRRCAFGTSPA